jgi:O-succinylbenzoic acid--CoA ligase
MDDLSVLAAAREFPKRDCLVVNGGVWSYGDVGERASHALALLRLRGIEPGVRVALTPTIDVDSIVWLYALFELGCPAVLVHPRLTDRERAAVLEEAKPAHVIADPVRDHGADEASKIGAAPDGRTLAIVYTSGSQGSPRGARLSRRAFRASAAAHAAHLGWAPADRWLLCMPPAHVGGLSILTRCLIARRCVVLGAKTFDPAEVVRIMARDRVTLLSVVPTMLRRLLMLEEPVWAPGPDLRAVLVGGAPFADGLRAFAVSRKVPALATYGCTEACSQITTQTFAESARPGSGGPLLGIDVRIEGNEIQVRGDVLMDGYLGEDRAGASWTADGWFRTGDLGCFLPDGQLLVRGRVDDRIVTGGENVSPEEVEAWLESVPGIASACVFGLPHDDWGQEVVAALAVEPTGYHRDTLVRRLESELAPHKRPKRIALLDLMPLNRSGKVDRAEVERRCAGRLQPI